ncbi:DUF2849 domain-containing protein [Rhodovulum sp. DZ06]|uniref:DUF2849 domain-containing protein n=1 Tax=Rhodovulum sp. DZ06 TaxID=3425126 RepID=UPI003D345AA7
MARIKRPVIVSANHLLTGETIYLSAEGWSTNIADARIGQPDDADAMLARAKAEGGIAVGPEVSEVIVTDAGAEPAHRRERIRRDGPTVGKLNPDLRPRHSAAPRAAAA